MVTTGVKSLFIDTNVLIRSTVATAPRHIEAKGAVEQFWNAGVALWISRQVLREYAAVLSRPQTYTTPLSGKVIVSQWQAFLSQFQIANENADVTAHLSTLLETFSMGGKQVHDANIVATMQVYGIQHLMTYNSIDFVRFSSHIQVIDPEKL